MFTKNLLPHSWRFYGWATFVLFFTFWTSLQAYSYFFVPEFTIAFSSEDVWYANMLDEFIAIVILSSLIIIGFSKEKVEDELVSLIRLEALQWGIYANYFILALCILFINGFDFLQVMIYNMFTPLFIFILRFYWLLHFKFGQRKEALEK